MCDTQTLTSKTLGPLAVSIGAGYGAYYYQREYGYIEGRGSYVIVGSLGVLSLGAFALFLWGTNDVNKCIRSRSSRNTL